MREKGNVCASRREENRELTLPEDPSGQGRNLAAPGGASLSFLDRGLDLVGNPGVHVPGKIPAFDNSNLRANPQPKPGEARAVLCHSSTWMGFIFQQFIPFPVAFCSFLVSSCSQVGEHSGFSRHGLQGWDKPSKQQKKSCLERFSTWRGAQVSM